jgi:hypothetical protein
VVCNPTEELSNTRPQVDLVLLVVEIRLVVKLLVAPAKEGFIRSEQNENWEFAGQVVVKYFQLRCKAWDLDLEEIDEFCDLAIVAHCCSQLFQAVSSNFGLAQVLDIRHRYCCFRSDLTRQLRQVDVDAL